MLTELYFKGLLNEYRRIFKCLNELIKLNWQETPDEPTANEVFEHAMMVMIDYMSTYGE